MGCSGSKSANIAETTESCDKPTFYINWASPVSRSVMMTATELGLLADSCVKVIS